MKNAIAAMFATALLVMSSGSAAERPREMSKKEVRELMTTARTPQDHLRLARHFEAEAKEFELDSAEHAQMAGTYRGHPTASESKRPGAPDTAAHCTSIAESLKNAAKEARALAAGHEQMSKK